MVCVSWISLLGFLVRNGVSRMCRMSGVSDGRLLLVGGVLSRRAFFLVRSRSEVKARSEQKEPGRQLAAGGQQRPM